MGESFPEGEFSWAGIYLGGIFLEGNFPGGDFSAGGSFVASWGAVFRGGVHYVGTFPHSSIHIRPFYKKDLSCRYRKPIYNLYR